MKPKLITIQALFCDGEKRPMQAMQISKNFCLLKVDKCGNAEDFTGWRGRYSLDHINTGGCIARRIKGRKSQIIEVAEQLESIIDFSFEIAPVLSESEEIALRSTLKPFIA